MNLKPRLLIIVALILASGWALFPRTTVQRVKRNGVFVYDTVRRVPLTRGLDLQGVLEVVLQAIPETKSQPITPAGMQTAQQIMTSRVDKLGVPAPNVAVQGGNQIVIQRAGVKDPAKAAKIIGTTGTLQMFDFEPNLEPPTVTGAGVSAQPAPLLSLYGLLMAVQKDASKGTPQGYYLFQTVKKKIKTKVKGKTVTKTQTTDKLLNQGELPFGAPDLKQLLLPYKNGKQPAGTQILKVPANREPVWCKGANNCIGAGRNGTSKDGKYWYLFKYTPTIKTKSGKILNPNGPPELTGEEASRLSGGGRPLILVAGTEDEFITGKVLDAQLARLAGLGVTSECIRFTGGHEVPASVLQEVAGRFGRR